MTTSTILLLILSVIVAAGLSFYQYLYKAKNNWKFYLFLAFLRFLAYFSIFLLLINPVVSTKTFEISKTPLPVVFDNSESITELGANNYSLDLVKKIKENKALNEKFDIQLFQFDSNFKTLENLDFKGRQTHIDQVAQNLKQFYRNQYYPLVLVSDGNQTIGNDYVYSFQQNTTVLPVVLGDTTSFLDLKINQLNVNKYAFLKNKFPVEVFLQYNGTKPINANFSIVQGNTTLYKQQVSFTQKNKAQTLSVLLNADKVGVQTFKAIVSSSEKEKNTHNNVKNFAVEVIDQRSEVAIISSIVHPDLGALKRAIESNQQRKVTVLKPQEVKSLQDYNVIVFYQPNSEFKSVFDQNKNLKLNSWIITGNATDFNFLEQNDPSVKFKVSSQKEEYSATYNSLFNTFAIDNISFEQFPPLEHPFGTVLLNGKYTTLLNSRIRNIETPNPLLVFFENGSKRQAFLFGENFWRWRLESHLQNKSFEKFDVFTDKIIQYLATNTLKKSLVVNHENFYNSGETIELNAQFFNKNYEFDENARLTIELKNNETKAHKAYDFTKGSNEYKVNLDGLTPGDYTFTVKETNTKNQYTGTFKVIDFQIEKQFVNPDLNRLKQLASNSEGKVFYPKQEEALFKFLLENPNYKSIEKAIIKQTPLIDWVWILIVMIAALAIEWLLRKYNGLL